MPRRRLRKRANGEGSVYYRECDGRWAAEITAGYDDRGRQLKSRVYGKTQAEARRKLDAMRERVDQGLDAIPERLTVAEFLERWLTLRGSQKHVSYKTAETYRDQVKVHIVPAIGRIELTRLTPEHVQEMANALLVKGKRNPRKNADPTANASVETLSPRTVKHCCNTLRAALNVAIEWNLIARNPAARIVVKQNRRRAAIYDEKQSAAFLEAIYGERLEALYWLALCIGPREGEILGLRWADFDFEAGTVQLLRSMQRVRLPGKDKSSLELVETKTKDSDRSVWLPQIVVEKVLAHQRRQLEERALVGSTWAEPELVFTTPKGTRLEPRNLLRDFYRIRNRAQLPPIRFHDLRHSAATILHMAGVPDHVIQNMLGHASVRTTQEIYTHTTLDGQKQAATKMDEIFRPVAVRVAVKHAKTQPS